MTLKRNISFWIPIRKKRNIGINLSRRFDVASMHHYQMWINLHSLEA